MHPDSFEIMIDHQRLCIHRPSDPNMGSRRVSDYQCMVEMCEFGFVEGDDHLFCEKCDKTCLCPDHASISCYHKQLVEHEKDCSTKRRRRD